MSDVHTDAASPVRCPRTRGDDSRREFSPRLHPITVTLADPVLAMLPPITCDTCSASELNAAVYSTEITVRVESAFSPPVLDDVTISVRISNTANCGRSPVVRYSSSPSLCDDSALVDTLETHTHSDASSGDCPILARTDTVVELNSAPSTVMLIDPVAAVFVRVTPKIRCWSAEIAPIAVALRLSEVTSTLRLTRNVSGCFKQIDVPATHRRLPTADPPRPALRLRSAVGKPTSDKVMLTLPDAGTFVRTPLLMIRESSNVTLTDTDPRASCRDGLDDTLSPSLLSMPDVTLPCTLVDDIHLDDTAELSPTRARAVSTCDAPCACTVTLIAPVRGAFRGPCKERHKRKQSTSMDR